MILIFCLVVQAALWSYHLTLLDLWTDELSLRIVVQPIGDVLRIAAADVHPPLYYLLQHYWLKLPLGMDPVAQMRLLSVVFALAATVVLDRLWLRDLPPAARRWFLALWTLSPCLLLYARMGRSYSLQTLVMAAAVWAGWCWIEKPGRRGLAFYCAGSAAALYVHYVPGVALMAGVGLALVWRRRWRDLAASIGVVGLAYLPWALVLADSLRRWTREGAPYHLTGGTATEWLLKGGYGALSFTLGETTPDWVLLSGVLLIPAAAWLVVEGARARPQLAWLVGPVAAVAFIGVARWVAYPFIPARLLFLYPFFLLLAVEGRRRRPVAASVVLAALAVISLAGLAEYLRKGNFLNKGYAMPFAEIAATIRGAAPAENSLIVCDTWNTDYPALEYYLGPGRPLLLIGGPDGPQRVEQATADPRIRSVWLFRNTHDISPGKVNSAIDRSLAASWHARRRRFLPFSPLQRTLARRLGVDSPPEYFHELVEFRR